MPLRVELEQLGGHILHGLAYARFCPDPLLRAEPVQHRRGSGVGGAVFLDQVQPGERNVKLRALGKFQNHELNRKTVLRNFLEPLVLRDAVLHMHHVVADAEIAEVGDKSRRLRLLQSRARRHVGLVGKVVGAEDDQVRLREDDARRQRRAHDDRHAQVAGHVAGFFEHGVARAGRAAAQPVGNLVLAKNRRQAFHVSLVRRGKHDACLRRHQVLQLLSERGNGAMEPQRGPRRQLDLAQSSVLIQHVHRAQLIQIEAHVRVEQGLQNLGAKINVLRAHERADSRALMPLFDFVPPAIDLVADHCRLVDKERASRGEREQRALRTGHGREKLPSWKDAHAARRSSLGRHLLILGLDALPAQPSIHRGQQMLGHRRLRQRQQLRLVQSRLRALRLGIEFADGLNLVAKELDAHRTVGFRRVDVQNSAAARKLPRHLDQIHLRVAHAGQVRGQNLDVDLFAALQRDGQPGVVLEFEELERRGFDGSNQYIDAAGRELPQRRRALLLQVGVRRKIFKGKHIVGGKAHHTRGIDGAGELASGLQQRLECLGGLVVGNDYDRRLLGGTRHQRQVKRPRRPSQSGHTPPPRTQAQVPANALKPRAMLQLREDLADKREDHQSSV